MSNEPGLPDTIDPAVHEQEVLRWQRARLRRLTTPDGWLSLVARTTLDQGANSVGSDPNAHVPLPEDRAPAQLGVIVREGAALRFEPAPGVRMQLKRGEHGDPADVQGPIELFADAAHAADRLLFGTLAFALSAQGDEITIRVRDSESARRLSFPGIDCYPIRHELRVVARLLPHDPPRPVELDYDSGRTEHPLSPGVAVFTLGGEEHRVEPVFDGNGTRLLVLFADPTNRDQTYGAGRFLYAPLPERGRVLLDWNQAFNPPCAFTPYAFCPLVPEQNRLKVRIEAGEKRPRY